MNKLKILSLSIIIGLTAAVIAIAFTGPGTRTPGTGNPDFWIKSGNDVYYNVIGGNVGIGTAGPGYKLDVNGNFNATSLYISGVQKNTVWDAKEPAISPGTTAQYWRGDKTWQTLPSAAVSSVFGRTGAVTAQSGDYTTSLVTEGANLYFTNARAQAAAWASPTFTGNVTMPGTGIWNSFGNVGIGTTGPGAKLEIKGGTADILLTGSEGYTAFKVMDGGTGDPGYLDLYRSGAIKVRLSPDISYFETGNVGIGTTDPGTNKLKIAGGNLDLSGSNITGVNKISVNTIDPVFNINGKKYATYVPDVAGGVSVHTYGKTALEESGSQFQFVIDFNAVEENSNLWLFAKTTDFGSKMENLVVSLTPEGQRANLYYQLDASKNQLIIYGDKPVTFSYSLSAPRIDHQKWGNLAEDQLLEGIDISEYQNK